MANSPGGRAAARTTLLALLLGVLVPVSASAHEGGRTTGAEPAVARAHAPSVGSAGVGDTYFPKDGNGGIDVRHYDIRNRYDFASGTLRGRTVLTLVAKKDLRRFNLDFLLKTTSVVVDGRPAKFRRDGRHELVITPKRTVAKGEKVKVRVRYRGTPSTKTYLGENAWLADQHEVVAMGQPHMSPWWFPANDHPSDKATFKIAVTVPKGKQVVANGTLRKKERTRTTTTWHWRARDPMATYLAFFAAGDFRIEKGRQGSRTWWNAVSKRLPERSRKAAWKQLRRSPKIVSRLERDLGAYPFETTGGVVTSLPVEFALENQTRPTYGAWVSSNPSVVVHELAHQWFGDSLGLRRWRDIWLNEGFATFMEWRYDERYFRTDPQARLLEMRSWYGPKDPFWDVRIGAPGAKNLFDEAIYDRGAMTLQALRTRIGEKAFWQLLRSWVDEHRDGLVAGAAFEAAAERASGQDLDGFFDAWLRSSDRPARTVENGLVSPD